MPNTPANVAIVTAAYNKWQKEVNAYNANEPLASKRSVDEAYAKMQKAIREWEKPGDEETSRIAKADRKEKRKRFWPKFK